MLFIGELNETPVATSMVTRLFQLLLSMEPGDTLEIVRTE